jgi:spermidine synthase
MNIDAPTASREIDALGVMSSNRCSAPLNTSPDQQVKRQTILLVFALFFCSGAMALVYEVIWSKYLSLLFGSTVQAQTVVLAVFMGGLALGNRLFGGRADRMGDPLAAYGYIEVAIGIYAFMFPQLYRASDWLFVKGGAALLDHSPVLLAWKGMLSVGLILLPTVLMGGTLPLISAWLHRQDSDAGRRSARFYALNSLGAVCGAAVGGFILVRQLGLISSLQMTGLFNVLIGFAAVAVARQTSASLTIRHQETAEFARQTLATRHLRLFCGLVALTGAVSMGTEVLAARALALVFGGSLQAFATVLIAFILGIGIGSALISSTRADRLKHPGTIVALLLGAAVWIGLFLLTIEQSTILYAKARTGLAPSQVGFYYNQVLVFGMALVVLGIPAAMLGALLPLSIRIVSQTSSELGREVGRLLTWNTIGAVVGVLLTGFVIMPLFGLRAAFGIMAVFLALLAMLIALATQRKRVGAVAALAVLLISSSVIVGGENWRHVLSSGVFRWRTNEIAWNALEARKKDVEILYYKDGADATVSVEKSGESESPHLSLKINGKPDASNKGDMSTQYLLGHLPLLAKPDSKDVFVLGFGSGVTGAAILGHPVNSLVIAENCKPVLEAAVHFQEFNRSVLKDPRTRVYLEDARTVLKLNQRKYDVIISEPSNPWVAGVGSVFSREFYQIAASRLKDGGIMAQWFHYYEMHDNVLELVARTFASVFPHIEIWDTQAGDLVMLGSLTPWDCSLDNFRKVFERDLPRRDLEEIGLVTPELVFIRQLASQNTGFALTGDGAIQSDIFPVLEYVAPKAFFLGATAREFFSFDERTVQSAFAPDAKRAALLSVPGELLGNVFKTYATGNLALGHYVQWRANHFKENREPAIYSDLPYLPIIFRPDDSYPATPRPRENASVELKELLDIEAALYTSPDQWRTGVLRIQELLTQQEKERSSTDWSTSEFAGLAVRTCVRFGELALGRETLELGLSLNRENKSLGYLDRVLKRFSVER